MFGKNVVRHMINRSAENETDRRVFLKAAGVAGLGTIGATAIAGAAEAGTPTQNATDAAVLNFALNLEYLEAEFYNYAAFGVGLSSNMKSGKNGKKGTTTPGRKVNFKTPAIANYAAEIATDELTHVKFLRKALGGAKVAAPDIDIVGSFTAGAIAAGVIQPGQTFDPYADEDSFLLGAFLFEDVGVTAYKGASPLITNKTYLEAAAGILAVEAYHAGIVRTSLYAKGIATPALFSVVDKLSGVRDAVDGKKDYDQGIGNATVANLVPTDKNGIAFSRSAAQVLNIVYLTPKSVKKGGFFPKGVNGVINKSSKNGK